MLYPIFERNMNMKTCIRVLCAVCCAAILLTMTACSGGNKNTSSATAEATPAPEITPAPEATAAPEEEPTPAPEGNTSSETGENRHTSTLPVPETGSEEFRAAFENNPIDTQYADDMETAGSVAGMITACNTASDSWKEQIDSVYTQILEYGDDKTVETVKEEQSHWVNEQSTALQDIRDSVSENDPLAAITVAESIMVYYRTRAIDLCAVLYDINGTLAFG